MISPAAHALLDSAVGLAADELVECGTRLLLQGLNASSNAAAVRELGAVVETIRRGATKFAKLDYVSFYSFKGKSPKSRPTWRATFALPGKPRRTERLGRDQVLAYRRAVRINDIIGMVRSRQRSVEDAWRELYVDTTSIETLVGLFIADLRTRGASEQYVETTRQRVTDCIAILNISRCNELMTVDVGELLGGLRKRTTAGKAQKLLSANTINYYLKDLRKFTSWLTKPAGGRRLASDPLRDAEGVRREGEARRRDATLEDLAWLHDAAVLSKKVLGGLDGEARSKLYLFAFATGLRRRECARAEVSWLTLVGPEPKVILPPGVAKNKNYVDRPLVQWLAKVMADWLGDRRSGPLFAGMTDETIKGFSADRDAARELYINDPSVSADERMERSKSDVLTYKNAEGVLVFHSLRHGFASTLLAADVDPKLVQHLTRHSTITLLFDRYGHAKKSRGASAIAAAIPNPIKPKTTEGG